MSNVRIGEATATGAVAVTPHDTTANVFKMLYVGGAGDVKVQTWEGQTTTFAGVPAGQYLLIQTKLVYSTDTTATNIVGLG